MLVEAIRMVTKGNQVDWDDISFVLSSTYRKAVLKQLTVAPATPSQIANRRDISISHVSRALGGLQEREIVELLVSEDRRKGRFYGVTDRGGEAWEKAREMEEDE